MFDNHFFKELKRRNVLRAGLAYLMVAWLILQVASIVFPVLEAPPWAMRVFLFVLIVGFPIWLSFAWVYEITPDGFRKTSDVKPDKSIAPKTGQRLNRVIIFALILVIILLLIDRFIIHPNSGPGVNDDVNKNADSEFITLATIPFSNISGEESTEYLGFALADQVINSLSYLKNIVVRPSSSIRKYEHQKVDPSQVAAELNVSHIVMGHYLKSEDSLRLNLELINVKENRAIWTQSITESMKDAFRLQDIVSERVIDGLKIQFTLGERYRMHKDVPQDPRAYEFYLQAVSYPSTVTGYQNAVAMLNKAIELDPTFSPAYVEMGNRLHKLARYALPEDQENQIQKAIQALEKALEINDEMLSAFSNLCLIYTELDDKGKAVQMARRALEINPNHAKIHFSLGYIYRYAGLSDESVKEMQKAVFVDPTNKSFRSWGVSLIQLGKYREALNAFTLDSDSPYTKGWRGMIYLKLGEFDKAKESLNRTIKLDPGGLLGYWAEAMLAYIEGNYDDGIMAMNQIVSTIKDSESFFHYATVYALLGDRQKALELLEKAVDEGYFVYSYMQIEPFLDSVRKDADFVRIVQKAERLSEEFRNKYL